MLSFLPDNIYKLLNQIDINSINEIRFRINSPIIINLKNSIKYLSFNGLSNNKNEAIICKSSMISTIISKSSNNCLYSINDQLVNGFITLKSGVRIGVCGEIVYINNEIKTIKNITSLNIRIPHMVKNCSLKCLLNLIHCNEVFNTLIISPAGCGKTTFIRDLAYQFTNKLNGINVLIVDERGEICSQFNNYDNNVSNNIDVYSFCSKQFGFENGIRSMKPDIIITDELNFDSDSKIIENAITCGVSVVATIHANNILDLKNKPAFNEILRKKLFKRFVVLSSNEGPGTLEGVFNENLEFIY